ncbi:MULTISPECIES: DUF3100 domain-containing protein [Arthrobacter]|uniref:DUF3100 domain-containing protein n=2 Tax=Arthrobacter TaxID=1663 RepID=A0ABU9KRG9_9MICC|nr:DUF3100 domain-containing protein [Arthrobacter sp. YJM1]MDP5228632.1 DUF3100 domain-containing protein [Arthrobacter sp. YJM1]
MSSTTTSRPTRTKTLPLAALALAVAVVAQLIGPLKIPVGIGTLLILPMVWGLLMGLVISVQKIKPLPVKYQRMATALSGIAVLVLCARLSMDIGPSLTALLKAGPALLLQEVGHLLGTIVLALPLAVLLRMGRATVGATFSLDREPAFAMVSERFGPNSDEYRGVLAMYVFGTIFGAVYISIAASLVANWKIFDPLALAMGSGVGSGSMMAASVASVTAAYPADKSAIVGMAAVSNLITSMLGVYVGMYIALPLADRFYRLLTRSAAVAPAAVAVSTPVPLAGSNPAQSSDDAGNAAFRAQVAEASAAVSVPLRTSLPIVGILGLTTATIADIASGKGFSWNTVIGYVVMMLIVLAAFGLAKLSRNKVQAVVWVTTLGAYLSSPWSPLAAFMHSTADAVDFVSITTIVLSFAGLSLGKDIGLLRKIGWKIIPVGLVAITASFLFATVIAEFSLGLWH